MGGLRVPNSLPGGRPRGDRSRGPASAEGRAGPGATPLDDATLTILALAERAAAGAAVDFPGP